MFENYLNIFDNVPGNSRTNFSGKGEVKSPNSRDAFPTHDVKLYFLTEFAFFKLYFIDIFHL